MNHRRASADTVSILALLPLAAALLVAPPQGAAAAAPTEKAVEIAPGVFFPSVNLGTCCGSDPKVGMPAWFSAGGTGIDTALDYGDQTVIGGVLKQLKKQRSSYFMTSKIPTHGATAPLSAAYALAKVQEDVKELGLDRLDLVLIHHPATDAENIALWRGMEQAVRTNLTKTIGLSNFNQAQIEALLKEATIRPVVNQCDLSVGGQDMQCGPRDAAIAYNIAQNISYQAWSPMRRCPFTDPVMAKIAASHNVSVAQVCLRWILERVCTMVL